MSFSLIIMVQLSHHFTDMHKNMSVSFNNTKIGVLGMTLSGTLL